MTIHLVFVDDDQSFHKLAKMSFRKEIEAKRVIMYNYFDGQECLDAVESKEVDIKNSIFFSDITMPNLDGVSLAEKLIKRFEKVNISLFSALNLNEYKELIKERLEVPFYPKPLRFKEVKNVLSL